MKIDRLLTIVITLLNNEKVTALDLAREFEVSVRTIYRDFETLNQAGIPIVAYPGYKGGFCLLENYKISRQLLTMEDFTSIINSLGKIHYFFDDEKIKKAMEKVNSLLSDQEKKMISLQEEEVIFDPSPWEFDEKRKDLIKKVHHAVHHRKLITFHYNNSHGRHTVRTIEPMSLIFKAGTWYAFGYCRLKEDFRVFKVSRMMNFHPEKEGFHRKPMPYNAEAIIEQRIQSKICVKLEFPLSMKGNIHEYFNGEKIEVHENSIVLHFHSPENRWLYATILSYGHKVRVLEPKSVRDKVARIIEKMGALYD